MKKTTISILTIGLVMAMGLLVSLMYPQRYSVEASVRETASIAQQSVSPETTVSTGGDRYFMFIGEPSSEGWQYIMANPGDRLIFFLRKSCLCVRDSMEI